MIVEDRLLITRQLEAIASSAGHVVVGEAATAEEACGLTLKVDPDIVFVDISLAGEGSGLDVARYVAEHSDAVVVFTTANRRRLPHDLCGAIGVVEKPFTRIGLLSALQYIAGRIQNTREFSRKPDSLELSPAYEHRWCQPGA